MSRYKEQARFIGKRNTREIAKTKLKISKSMIFLRLLFRFRDFIASFKQEGSSFLFKCLQGARYYG